jgi:outer membrane lipoprotein-sorting protein
MIGLYRMSRLTCTFVMMLSFAALGQTSAPTSEPSNDAYDRLLDSIDKRAGAIHSLEADFVQEKRSPLLRKPLISRGTVRAKGALALWKTNEPEPSEMSIDPQRLRMYYPRQHTIEEYQMQQNLGMLAASPLPGLSAIRKSFSTKPDVGSSGNIVPVRMEPLDAELRKYVDHVRVALDAERGVVTEFEMVDPDGEQTLITFTNIRTDVNLSDEALKLDAPAGTKIVRPLEGAPSR